MHVYEYLHRYVARYTHMRMSVCMNIFACIFMKYPWKNKLFRKSLPRRGTGFLADKDSKLSILQLDIPLYLLNVDLYKCFCLLKYTHVNLKESSFVDLHQQESRETPCVFLRTFHDFSHPTLTAFSSLTALRPWGHVSLFPLPPPPEEAGRLQALTPRAFCVSRVSPPLSRPPLPASFSSTSFVTIWCTL